MHSCRDYLPSLESEEEVDLLHSSTRTPLSKTVDLRIIEQAHRISFERLLLHHTRLLDCKRMNKDVDSSCKIITPQTVLDLLQLVYDAGFNYAVECTNLDKRIITLTKLLEILPQLLSLTSKQSKGQAYYYEYKIYELLGYAYSDSFRIAQVGGNSHERFIETLFLRANESLHAALESWEKLRVYKYYGSGAGVSDPYKEVSDVLVQLSAMHCYHYLQGSEDLAESDSYLLGYSYANRSITLVDAVWRSRDLNYDQFLAQVVGSTVDELFVSDQMELRVCDQRNKPLLQQKGESTYRKDEYLVTLPLGVVLSLASTHAHGLNCLLQNTRLDLSTVDELQQNALANSAAQHCSIVLWLSCHRSEDEESLYSLLLELLPAISSVTSSTDTNKRSQLWNLCNQIIEKLKRQDKPPNKQKVFRRKKIKYKEEL